MATEKQLKYWESLKSKVSWNKGKKNPNAKCRVGVKHECVDCGAVIIVKKSYIRKRCDNCLKELRIKNILIVGKDTRFKNGMIPKTYNNGNGFIDNGGYKRFMINSKSTLEHHIIFCTHNGLDKIPKGFEIHHINDDKLDNRIDNLMLLTKSEHVKLHWKLGKTHNRGD